MESTSPPVADNPYTFLALLLEVLGIAQWDEKERTTVTRAVDRLRAFLCWSGLSESLAAQLTTGPLNTWGLGTKVNNWLSRKQRRRTAFRTRGINVSALADDGSDASDLYVVIVVLLVASGVPIRRLPRFDLIDPEATAREALIRLPQASRFPLPSLEAMSEWLALGSTRFDALACAEPFELENITACPLPSPARWSYLLEYLCTLESQH